MFNQIFRAQRSVGRCETLTESARVRFRSHVVKITGSYPLPYEKEVVFNDNLGGNTESFRPIGKGRKDFLFC